MKSSILSRKLIVSSRRKKLCCYFAIGFLVVCLCYSCTPKPYSATNKLYKQRAKALAATICSKPLNNDSVAWVGTTNFGLRKPNFVIIHHTAQNSCEQTLKVFTKDSTQVSAHYLICRDGTLHHLLNDYLRAWHAGAARWGNNTDINSASLGIELDNNGVDTFTNIQLQTLENLLDTLKEKYNIPTANFIGHADIAPGRKVDPSIQFPWKRMADKGYGLWYADTTNITIPPDFNSSVALRVIGYDISKPVAATQAFRLHFLQSVLTGALTESEKKVLFMVMQKFL